MNQRDWDSNPGHAVESCSMGANNAAVCFHTQQHSKDVAARWKSAAAAMWSVSVDGCDHSHSGHHHVLWRVRENASWTVPTREREER